MRHGTWQAVRISERELRLTEPKKKDPWTLTRPQSSLLVERSLVAPRTVDFSYSDRSWPAGTPPSIAYDTRHRKDWRYTNVYIGGWWFGSKAGWTPYARWVRLKMEFSPFHHPWVVVDATGLRVLLPTDQHRPLHNPRDRERCWSGVLFTDGSGAPTDDLSDRLHVTPLPSDGVHPVLPGTIDATGIPLPPISRAILGLPALVLAGLSGRKNTKGVAAWAWYAARWAMRNANGGDMQGQVSDLYRVLQSVRAVPAFTLEASDLYHALYAFRQKHFDARIPAMSARQILTHWHDPA